MDDMVTVLSTLAGDAQHCTDAPTDERPIPARLAAYVRSRDECVELEQWAASIGHELVAVYDASTDHEGRWDRALVRAAQRAADRKRSPVCAGLAVVSYDVFGDDPLTVALFSRVAPLHVARRESEPRYTRSLRGYFDTHDAFRTTLQYANRDRGRDRHIEETGWQGGVCVPYGYMRDGKGALIENPYEMDTIARSLTMRTLGASLETIAQYWIDSGIRLRRGRQPFHPSTISRALNRLQRRGLKPQPVDNLARMVMSLPVDAAAE